MGIGQVILVVVGILTAGLCFLCWCDYKYGKGGKK